MITRPAVRMLEGRVLRRGRAGTALLVLVLAVSAGAIMAVAAGGRRAATSYDRFLAWSGGADASVSGSASGGDDLSDSENSALADANLAIVQSLPEVQDSSRSILIADGVAVRGHRVAFTTLFPIAADLRAPAGGRGKVLDGRLPDPGAVDEAVIPFDTAGRFDLHVGDAATVLFDERWDHPEWWAGEVPVRIVGIIAAPGMFPSFTAEPAGVVLLTPAFLAAHAERVDWTSGDVRVRLRDDVDVDEFRAAVEAAGVPFDHIPSLAEDAVGVRKLVRMEAGALWLIAAVIGALAVIVVLQLFRRDVLASSTDLVIVHAIGMPRRDLAAAGALRGALVGLAGAAGAVVLALAASPLFPRGVARIADPSSGLHADLTVLSIGAVATLGVSVVVGAGAVVWATRRRTRAARPMPLGRLVNRLPASPAAGVRLAFEAPRDARSAPRSGLLGLGAIVLVLVAAVSVRASLDRLVGDPDLAGRTWDMTMAFDDPAAIPEAGRLLDGDPDVTGYTRGGWWSFVVDGRPVYTAYLEPSSSVGVAMEAGRAPLGEDEIGLGAAEMDALGVSIGDTVEVGLTEVYGQTFDATVQATVVGRAVLAAPAYQPLAPGEGGVVTTGLVRRIAGDGLPASLVFVELRDGAALLDTTAEIAEVAHPDFWFPRAERSAAGSLLDLRSVLHLVLGVLAVLGAAALLHRLVTTARAQRRQLAVLRAIGFSDRQLLAAGASQGVTIGLATLLVTVPLGVVGAALAWRRIAGYLVVVARPSTSITLTCVIAGAVVAIAAGAALVIVAHSSRRSSAELLRVE